MANIHVYDECLRRPPVIAFNIHMGSSNVDEKPSRIVQGEMVDTLVSLVGVVITE